MNKLNFHIKFNTIYMYISKGIFEFASYDSMNLKVFRTNHMNKIASACEKVMSQEH